MIQHIYDSDQTVYLSTPITELMCHVNIFAAADKYDVPSLRVLVVNKFTVLMGQKWSSSQQVLYGHTTPLRTQRRKLCGFITPESRSCILHQKYSAPHKSQRIRQYARRVWTFRSTPPRYLSRRQGNCQHAPMPEM
jgi:hypothetical protein